MKNLLIPVSLLFVFVISACGDPNAGKPIIADTTKTDTTKPKVGFSPLPMISPEYPDAKLTLLNLNDGAVLDTGEFTFKFAVSGFELGKMTEDAANKGINNSDMGQHIHVILSREGENDQPYMAHYSAEAKIRLKEGNYLLTAFLSRSYHESVKTPGSYVLTRFSVGQKPGRQVFDLKAPAIVYSRPKGKYEGKDAKRILLDWYQMNVELSTEGYQMSITITSPASTENLIVDFWQPYVFENLPAGKTTIMLMLLDKDGLPAKGKPGPVSREFEVAP